MCKQQLRLHKRCGHSSRLPIWRPSWCPAAVERGGPPCAPENCTVDEDERDETCFNCINDTQATSSLQQRGSRSREQSTSSTTRRSTTSRERSLPQRGRSTSSTADQSEASQNIRPSPRKSSTASISSDTPAVSGYVQPPANILEVMRAPTSPQPIPTAMGDRLLLAHWQNHPTLEQVARPYKALAGVRVDPSNRHRRGTPGGYGIRTFATSLDLVDVATKATRRVALPKDGQVPSIIWSADGNLFIFENVTPNAVELWIGNGALVLYATLRARN